MSGPPSISVVIPAYNAAAFIAETLATVAAQTFRDFEVVIVDDGSKDDTQAAAERALRELGLPGRCVRQANKGISGARNAGVAAAQGEIIALLDHDDAFHPEKLAEVARAFREHPEADFVAHHIKVTQDGRFVRIAKNGPVLPDMYEGLLFGRSNFSPSCVSVRKSRVLEIGGFREDERYNAAEGDDSWLRLAKVCRFHVIDRVLAEYRYDDKSLSRRAVYQHSHFENVLRDHFAEHFGESPSLPVRLAIRHRLSGVYRSALGTMILYGGSSEDKRAYAWRMIRAWPLHPKNIYRFVQWLLFHR